MAIPLVDLKAQYLSIKRDIDESIKEVINNSSFIKGPFLKRFEENFAKFVNSRYSVGTSNGTSSVYIALKALGIKKGHEVIVPVNTFIGTTEPITMLGAKIRFVDIDNKTYNIRPELIEDAITENTKAVIPVHLYGHAADMDKIKAIAEKHNLEVIEDAAQAHGAEYKGKKIGSISKITSFSFFPAKILGCYGDGGAVTTNDKALYELLSKEVDHGRETKYESVFEAFNFRLDALQANILNAKLKYLDEWIRRRRYLAELYTELLPEQLIPPKEESYAKHAYYMYVARINTKNKTDEYNINLRQKLLDFLKSRQISAGIHYPVPLHLQKAYSYLGYKKGSFPVAEDAANKILSLPLYPELSDDDIAFITNTIKEFFRKNEI